MDLPNKLLICLCPQICQTTWFVCVHRSAKQLVDLVVFTDLPNNLIYLCQQICQITCLFLSTDLPNNLSICLCPQVCQTTCCWFVCQQICQTTCCWFVCINRSDKQLVVDLFVSTDLPNNLLIRSMLPNATSGEQQQLPATTTIYLNPLFGVAPLGPQPQAQDHTFRQTMLEHAYRHMPQPSDSERVRWVLNRTGLSTSSRLVRQITTPLGPARWHSRWGMEEIKHSWYCLDDDAV